MSVAFRRESDEEHLEPRFELPLPRGPNIVTPRGLALIEARNRELEDTLAATTDAEQRKVLARDLRYWRQRLVSAQVAPPATGDTVAIGSSVTIEQAGRARTIAIVGHDEAEPAAGRLAFTAPLARAVLGAELGDQIDFGDEIVTILAVTLAPGEPE